MKIILFLFLCVTLMFAVKPVPRPNKSEKTKSIKTSVEVVQTKDDEDRNDKKKDDGKKMDRIKDDDGDGVNDHREDDFQKIKNTKSKHKHLIKKKSSAPDTKPSRPKKIKKK